MPDMERLGLHLPFAYKVQMIDAQPLWTEINENTGMVATVYQDGDDDGLIVETYQDAVGLVTWYRADNETQVLQWLGLQ